MNVKGFLKMLNNSYDYEVYDYVRQNKGVYMRTGTSNFYIKIDFKHCTCCVNIYKGEIRAYTVSNKNHIFMKVVR